MEKKPTILAVKNDGFRTFAHHFEVVTNRLCMKLKYSLLIILSGFILIALGALFKLASWEFASRLIIAGLILKLIGGVLLIYKLLTLPRVKDFLNQ